VAGLIGAATTGADDIAYGTLHNAPPEQEREQQPRLVDQTTLELVGANESTSVRQRPDRRPG
jgi:hypothetical protein